MKTIKSITAMIIIMAVSFSCASNKTVTNPEIDYQNYKSCPPEGSAIQSDNITLNKLKNRYKKPQASEIDTLDMLSFFDNGNDKAKYNSDRAFSVVAYVKNVKNQGEETANCGDKYDTDIHIELLPDSGYNALPFIAEITPRFRAIKKSEGLDWSFAAIKAKYLNKRVRITGWAMYDHEHANSATNTNPTGKNNWRVSAWEIHPITSIEII